MENKNIYYFLKGRKVEFRAIEKDFDLIKETIEKAK